MPTMKTRLWMTLVPLLLAWPAFAAGPAALDVAPADLTAAGLQSVNAVPPAEGRFMPPVRYFRTGERLSSADAKKDCSDCYDLIAVFAAEVPGAPYWADAPRQQFVKVGGRFQLRAYIKTKRRVVTVTAPSEATARKISAYLVTKFSK